MNNKSSGKFRRAGWLAFTAAAALAILFFSWPRVRPQNKTIIPVVVNSSATGLQPSSVNSVSGIPVALELTRRKVLFASFQKHPFAVAHESGVFGWTAEDGKNPEVIKKLAHNELEFERMAEETARIYRRQLVYHKTTSDVLVENSKLTGEPIRQFTLPGLDGQEVQVEVTKSELSPSGQQGTFSGRVVGRDDSMVTLAFKGGREAFTVISPTDKIFLQGDPREPGELIVKSIDPATYVAGVCGTP